MNLIDLYVEAVIKFLPQENKEDAARTLRSQIAEKLPPNPSDEEVRRVLEELGNPRQQAKNFDTRQRYLIGPEYYDSYISILKLVVGILITVMLVVTVLHWIIAPPSGGIIKFIVDLILSAVNGAIQATAWVTIVFAIIERNKLTAPPVLDQAWTPDDLSKEKSAKLRIKRSDAFVSIFFTVAFTAILIFRPELFSFFSRSGDTWNVVPILNLARLQDFIPLILVIAFLELGISSWKIIARHWNMSLAFANLGRNLATMALSLTMLWNRAIINPNLAGAISQYFGFSTAAIDRSIGIAIWVLIAIIIVAALIDSIIPFAKLARYSDRRDTWSDRRDTRWTH